MTEVIRRRQSRWQSQMSDPKAELQGYLQGARDALVWKLDGLSEYDIRRPMTPTGTNLLGLVKHCAGTELGYFGFVFGRPADEPTPWIDDPDPNADMWATVDESRDDIVNLYRRAWVHSDATIAALPLDATGDVFWWPEARRHPTLHHVLIHVIADVATPRRTRRHRARTDRRCRGPAPARQQPARPRRRLVDHLPRKARTRAAREAGRT